MNKLPLLLIGAGGHARACIDVIEQGGHYSVVGLIGSRTEVGKKVFGYSVLAIDEDLPDLLKKYPCALVTVGQIKTPDIRVGLFNRVKENGARLPTILSPHAYVSSRASIGEGTIVLHGAVVNAGAIIGRNCIINSQALVEHDAVIGDHCHIATSATINGQVKIDDMTFVGSNACVRQALKIGKKCLIGMGQHILTDCEAGTVIPAPRNQL